MIKNVPFRLPLSTKKYLSRVKNIYSYTFYHNYKGIKLIKLPTLNLCLLLSQDISFPLRFIPNNNPKYLLTSFFPFPFWTISSLWLRDIWSLASSIEFSARTKCFLPKQKFVIYSYEQYWRMSECSVTIGSCIVCQVKILWRSYLLNNFL